MNDNPSVPSTKTTSSPSPAVIVAVAAELALKVVALRVLARTPRERVRMGVRWPWGLAIVLVNTFGSLAFLTVGRKRVPVDDVPAV